MDRRGFVASVLAFVGLSRVKVEAAPVKPICEPGRHWHAINWDGCSRCDRTTEQLRKQQPWATWATAEAIPARIEGRTAWSPEFVTYDPQFAERHSGERPYFYRLVDGEVESKPFGMERRREVKPLPRMLARDRRGAPTLPRLEDSATVGTWMGIERDPVERRTLTPTERRILADEWEAGFAALAPAYWEAFNRVEDEREANRD